MSDSGNGGSGANAAVDMVMGVKRGVTKAVEAEGGTDDD